MNPEAFSRRAALVLGGITAVSLVTAFLVGLGSSQGDGGSRPRLGDRGPLGYRGIVELLESRGRDVSVDRSGDRHSYGNPVHVFASPAVDTLESVRALVESGADIVLILPKWQIERPLGVGSDVATLVPAADVAKVLASVGLDGAGLRRERAALRATVDGLAVDLVTPQFVRTPPDCEVVRALDNEHALAIAVESNVLVVTDPDFFNNHGLIRGDHAALALELLGESDRPVTFHEARGRAEARELWSELLQFPLGLVTITILLLAVGLAWRGLARFGTSDDSVDKIGLGRGRLLLVENTAALLSLGGHGVEALRRAWDVCLRDLAAALSAPPSVVAADRVRWLSGALEARGLGREVMELDAAVLGAGKRLPEPQLVALARRIRRLELAATGREDHDNQSLQGRKGS